MDKQKKDELKQLAKAVFADDKKATHYNVDASARFLTDEQFDKLDAEDKKGFVKITNPAFEVAEAEDAEAAAKKAAEDAEKAAKKAAKKAEADAAKAAKKAAKEPK